MKFHVQIAVGHNWRNCTYSATQHLWLCAISRSLQ